MAILFARPSLHPSIRLLRVLLLSFSFLRIPSTSHFRYSTRDEGFPLSFHWEHFTDRARVASFGDYAVNRRYSDKARVVSSTRSQIQVMHYGPPLRR